MFRNRVSVFILREGLYNERMKCNRLKNPRFDTSAIAGFSMLELMVSIAIMLFVGAQVFVSIRSLNQTVYLNRAAQELGFAIRRAQTMALAVSAVPIGGVYQIPPSIGIRLSFTAGDNGHYFFFSDVYDGCPGSINPDKKYSGTCEQIEPDLLLPRGITIKSINNGGLITVTEGYIIFITPEATLTLKGKSGILFPSLDPMNIVLTSSSGQTRTVRVRLSGQVTILNP